jgi:hypothetical protein
MTPQDTTTKQRVSRRHVLTALSGATIGLSGCLGGLLGRSTITKTSVQPFNLVVTLREGASVSNVNLIAPNGTAVSSKRVPAGQTSVSLPLLTADVPPSPLAAGTYTIAVANNGETVAKQEIQLKAAWKLTDVRAANNTVDVIATFKNTGKLPIRITYLGLTDGVPHPIKPPQKRAIAAPTRTRGERTRYQHLLGTGERATFSTVGSALVFYDDPSERKPQWYNKATQCRGSTHNATLAVRMTPTGTRTYSVPITYTGKPVRDISIRKCSTITVGNASRKSSTR